MALDGYSYWRVKCDQVLTESIAENNVSLEKLENTVSQFVGNEEIKRSALEHAFRDVLLKLLNDKGVSEQYFINLLQLSISAASADRCSFLSCVNLMNDIFDLSTTEKSEKIFEFVESRVDTWKNIPESQFNTVKNNLLRICNDLLRKLSRSQNTVFCGRILLFLAKFFPLSERSGLNIVGEFNYDNITQYSSQDVTDLDLAQEKDDSEEEGEVRDTGKSIRVDYNLYRKFWSLQDFFRSPNEVYNKLHWRTFIAHSADVLSAFGSFKLEDVKFTHNEHSDKPAYFAKYLTNHKLLHLQLSDSNFRRCVLVQYLIMFQYLTSSVKFRVETFTLTDDQSKWIKDTTDTIYKLLEETPPDGVVFAKSIQHILAREENWNNWKNDGCPNFSDVRLEGVLTERKLKRRKLGDVILESDQNNKMLIGHPALTKLWNLCPDNMEASKTTKNFLPSLESYFEEAVSQADPANQIEEEYKQINNSNWGWRALRLLARRSPHFFVPNNQPISKLPQYLDTMIKKVSKDFPQPVQEMTITDTADASDIDDEILKQTVEPPVPEAKKPAIKDVSFNDLNTIVAIVNPNLVTADQLKTLAHSISFDWKPLAVLLKFEEDEIAYFETDNSEAEQQANKMLTVWREREPEESTKTAIWQACKTAGLNAAAESAFGPEPMET